MKKIVLIILAASLPLMANQATLALSSNLPNGAISPYTGTYVNTAGITTTVQLYCDDINDGAWYNTYNIQVDSLAQAAGSGLSTGQTAGRFSTAASLTWTKSLENNTTVATPPNATDLYEEAAWLFAQIAGNASAQQTYIQEAAWELMTSATSVPNWSQYGNPQNQGSADWLQLAATYYGADTKTGSVALGAGESGVNVTLSTTNYSNWFVADAAPVGGVLPTNDSANQTWQEFLTYNSTGNFGTGGGGSSTPEPATFGLLGGALLIGGLYGRRKSAKK